jgi:hypothetical protein
MLTTAMTKTRMLLDRLTTRKGMGKSLNYRNFQLAAHFFRLGLFPIDSGHRPSTYFNIGHHNITTLLHHFNMDSQLLLPPLMIH